MAEASYRNIDGIIRAENLARMTPKQAPTLRDVARLAGVSTMTASRAMRTGFYVSATTKRKIERAAAVLNYRPDAQLSEMMTHIRRTRRPGFTGTLALLKGVTAEWPVFPDSPPNRAVLASVARRADELGYALYEHSLAFDQGEDRLLQRVLRARGVKGLMIYPPPGAALRLPFHPEDRCAVVLGNAVSEPRLHRVMGNERSATRLALREAAARGYRRPGLVMHRLADTYTEHAWTPEFLAYQQGLPARSRIPVCIYPEWTERTPPTLAAWWEKHRPDLILAPDFDVHTWLRGEGVRFPEDAGFISLGLEATDAEGLVAGTKQNFTALGALLVDQLVALLQRGAVGEPDLVVDCFVEASWAEGPTVRPRIE